MIDWCFKMMDKEIYRIIEEIRSHYKIENVDNYSEVNFRKYVHKHAKEIVRKILPPGFLWWSW